MQIGMRVSCLLLSALFLSGCDEWALAGSSDRYKDDFHFTYPLTATGRVEVENFNGSVEISGWDQDNVDISGTKYANTPERLKEVKVDIAASPGSVTIRTARPLDRRGNAGARYTIRVPKRAELASIATSNGPIRVEFMEGMVHLKTSNGPVRTRATSGGLDVQTSNGPVEISDAIGPASLRTSNGPIRAEVRRGNLVAVTSNGSITVRLIDPDTTPVRVQSSNGNIEVELDHARDVHAETSNSSITIKLPPSVDADLHARTSNGSINSDFDVTTHGAISKNRLEGTIGKGGPLLDLATSNGRIRLLRM